MTTTTNDEVYSVNHKIGYFNFSFHFDVVDVFFFHFFPLFFTLHSLSLSPFAPGRRTFRLDYGPASHFSCIYYLSCTARVVYSLIFIHRIFLVYIRIYILFEWETCFAINLNGLCVFGKLNTFILSLLFRRVCSVHALH